MKENRFCSLGTSSVCGKKAIQKKGKLTTHTSSCRSVFYPNSATPLLSKVLHDKVTILALAECDLTHYIYCSDIVYSAFNMCVLESIWQKR